MSSPYNQLYTLLLRDVKYSVVQGVLYYTNNNNRMVGSILNDYHLGERLVRDYLI